MRLTVVLAQDPPYIFANECGPWWKDYASPPCCSDASCEGLAYQCQVTASQMTWLARSVRIWPSRILLDLAHALASS